MLLLKAHMRILLTFIRYTTFFESVHNKSQWYRVTLNSITVGYAITVNEVNSEICYNTTN